MSKTSKLPLTEELDFAYLLELMPALHHMSKFAWLPELFSIIGHESLVDLCKYAGGEVIRIPTIEELTTSIEALQWYYDVYIKKSRSISEIPVKFHGMIQEIVRVYQDDINN